MANKPLLYGDERSDIDKYNPRNFRGLQVDPSRIPGYSEIVAANSIAQADDLTFREKHRASKKIKTKEDAYRQIGAHPQDLPVELQWLPISNVVGESSGRVDATLDHYKHREGFRLAKREDLEAHGFGFPPAGREDADGIIRRGHDVALFIRSGEVARMWEKARQEDAAAAEGATLPPAFDPEAPTFREDRRSKEQISHAALQSATAE